VTIIISGVLGGALAWLALYFLAPVAADPPYPPDEISAFVRGCLEHRGLVPLAALPGIACGAMLLRSPRRSIVLVVLGSLAVIAPFAIVFICFLGVIAPMYVYRPI